MAAAGDMPASGHSSPVPETEDEDADRVMGNTRRSRRLGSPYRGETDTGEHPNPISDEEQFRLFQAFLRQQQGGRESARSFAGRNVNGRGDSDDERTGGANGPPPEWSGPSTCSFEDWLIRARLWLATTKTKAVARGPLLLKALSGPPFESFKYLAKDMSWLRSKTNAEELLAKMDTPEQYGDDQEEHLLESLARITYHLKRQKGEGWREYFARWEQALRRVREHKVDLPSTYLGFLLINGLKLEDSEIKAMMNYTRGSIEPASIKAWLRKNEARLTVSQLGVDKDAKKNTQSNAIMFADAEVSEENEVLDTNEVESAEAFLAELDVSSSRDVEGDGDSLSEGEAAEILSTIIQKKKRTFTQSMKAKKSHELSRGYGKPSYSSDFAKGKGRSGQGRHYHLTVDGIRSLVRCYNCDQKGHIARHCPNPKKDKARPSTEKEINYLGSIDPQDEVHFCGLLDTDGPLNDVPAEVASPAASFSTLQKGVERFEQGVRTREYYMQSCFDLFFFENSICNSTPRINVPEEACATIDTGCQRTAVGINTLRKLLPLLPPELPVVSRRSSNRFRSVHGTSETERVALVPCSLGPKGCFINPAIFEAGFGQDAPFLLSLPFLLKSQGKLILDPESGLGFQMQNPSFFIPCHLGPSGALRVQLNRFTDRMKKYLSNYHVGNENNDFEILNLIQSSELPELQATSRAEPSEPLCVSHGGCCSQEASRRCPLLGRPCLEEVDLQAALDHATAHPALGEALGSNTGPGRDPTTTSRRSSSPTTSSRRTSRCDPKELKFCLDPCRDEQREVPACSSSEPRISEIPTKSNLVECYPSRGNYSRSNRRPTRFGSTSWTKPDLQLQSGDDCLGSLHLRSQSPEDLPSMPPKPWSPMSILPMAQGGSVERSSCLEVSRHNTRSSSQQPGDCEGHDSRSMPSLGDHQTGKQRVSNPPQLQEMPEGPGDHQQGAQTSPGGCGLGRLSAVPALQGNLQGVPEVTVKQLEAISPKKLRQMKLALKQAITFWKSIQKMFSASGMDDEAITDQIRRLNSEILEELLIHPKGTKKTRQAAEVMHLTPHQLRTVAEIYNPGCFGRLAHRHGLLQGLAFDITLGTDLLQAPNREGVKHYIRTVKPGLVLLAPPCEMYSQLQNLLKHLREKDPIKMRRFLSRKREAHQLLSFAVEIAWICIELNLTFVLEHPWSASSWVTRTVSRLLEHDTVTVARCDQCMFGLRSFTDQPHRKRTGFATNNQKIAESLRVTCDEAHKHQHIIGGHLSKKTQVYPEALLHKILKVYKQSIQDQPQYRTSSDVIAQDKHINNYLIETVQPLDPMSEAATSTALVDIFAVGEEIPQPAAEDVDFDLDMSPEELPGDPAVPALPVDSEEPEPDDQGDRDLPGSRPVRLTGLIRKAHEGLGHPSPERFLRILKYSNAKKEVLDAARNFKCTACERNRQVKPPRRAAPPREIDINEIVGVDVVWLPSFEANKTVPSLNIIDWNTHFQMMIPMKNKSPESVREAYRHWLRFFGPPKNIALDLGREFEGSFALRAETDGSFIDPSSVESPFQRGITERNGKTFKLMLSKAMEQHVCRDQREWEELVDIVVFQKNRLLMRNGFSPIQRVIGFTPKIPGGLLSGDAGNRSFPDKVKLGDEGVVRAMKMRKAASMAFHQTECEDALRRAISSGPRPFQNFEVGEIVYFWRVGQGSTRKPAPTYWHGPARVVMTDPPSTLWLSYQGTLVKASPERVRRTAEEEQLTLTGWIDDLVKTRERLDQEPKRGFLDLSEDPLPAVEGEDGASDYEPSIAPADDGDDQPPWQGPLPVVERRLKRKTDVREAFAEDEEMRGGDILLPEEDLRANLDRDAPPEPERPSEGALPDTAQPDGQPEHETGLKRESPDDIEDFDEPEAKRIRNDFLDIMFAKVTALIQTRQRKEVKPHELNKTNKLAFDKATKKEVTNNINIGAYQPISLEESARARQEHPEKVMSSRYVYTAKPLEQQEVGEAQLDGLLLDWSSNEPHKAKVRHVMQGYSEDGSEFLNSTTPQITRDGVMFVVQIIASMSWKIGFMDFTQAFHSGDLIDRLLFAEQPREGMPNMVPGQLIKILKTCYGLTDGPFAWYRHISRVLMELGYEASRADPCLFLLHGDQHHGQRPLLGIIALATDDLLHGGGPEHLERMENLKKRYKMGKYQFSEGRFCGKNYRTTDDGSIIIDQEHFVQEKVHVIQIDSARRKQRYSKCTDQEISDLRTLLGSLSWLAKESRPDLAGRTALLQQTLPQPRVRDLIEANLVAAEAYKHADSGIKVSAIPISNLRVGVISDASWGNAKGEKMLENSLHDWWEESSTTWTRHHVDPRSTLFHPAASTGGPDLHDLLPTRRTIYQNKDKIDNWTTPSGISATEDQQWTGKTIFEKQPNGAKLPHDNINELFLQLLNTSSQGGAITMYYDKKLETSPDPQRVTIASWKSTRLKRKTVNTLSAECQAMVSAVGNAHWHRFLLLEAVGYHLSGDDWEHQLAAVPYVSVTDSKSLFDCLHKLICSYTQADDKRTAIDIAILKDDLQRSGGHARWIEGTNMLADPLTKKMKGAFLRGVANDGLWSLSFHGHQKLRNQYDVLFTNV